MHMKMWWGAIEHRAQKEFGIIAEGSWHKLAQERVSWKDKCRTGLDDTADMRVKEDVILRRQRWIQLHMMQAVNMEMLLHK